MTALDICVDVSHWQGHIDWKALYNQGIRIAMIKATEGANFIDNLFVENKSAAEAAGIVVIPYHFIRPQLIPQQAEFFVRTANLQLGSMCAIDWEQDENLKNGANVSEVNSLGMALAKIIGRDPLGYWGIPGSGSNPGIPAGAMLSWPRWVSRYPKNNAQKWDDFSNLIKSHPEKWWITPPGSGQLLFAQYTQWAKMDGVEGNIDRSVAFFDSIDQALNWVKTGNISDPIPTPIPSPNFEQIKNLATQIATLANELASIASDLEEKK